MMTGRTHDLVALTLLHGTYFFLQPPPVPIATVLAAIAGASLGGLLPDIDDHTSEFWQRIPVGTFIGKIAHPIIGGHRRITHSLLGITITGLLLHFFLPILGRVLLVDMTVVWWSIMIGYVSHLLADSVTHEGIPLYFPIPWKIGFPPFKFLRIKTGGFIELGLIFPALFLLNGYLFAKYHVMYVEYIRAAIR